MARDSGNYYREENNGANLDRLLVHLEVFLFSKVQKLEIREEDIEDALNLANKLIKHDEEYTLMRKEMDILLETNVKVENENARLNKVIEDLSNKIKEIEKKEKAER